MAKALDGTALYAYFRRLDFSRETQEVLIHIRSSPPSRTPGRSSREYAGLVSLQKDALHHQGGEY